METQCFQTDIKPCAYAGYFWKEALFPGAAIAVHLRGGVSSSKVTPIPEARN